MCGRFTLYSSAEKISKIFNVSQPVIFSPSYNIVPGSEIITICALEQDQNAMVPMRWGLIPSWTKDLKKAGFINAKIETIKQKPSFRTAYSKRHCLIPVDGFYEWYKTEGGIKQPYFIHRKDEHPFAFAGIWERYQKEETIIVSCSIITQAADMLLKKIHDRMPVIISPEDYNQWLENKAIDLTKRADLSDEFEMYPVTTQMNKPSFNKPLCVEPIQIE